MSGRRLHDCLRGQIAPGARPWARLATRPSATGSSVTLNTSGIVAVAAFAANAGAVPPVAIMTAT
jgi:hypothetical protein